MAGWTKWLWGGMGWAMFGPIGGIMGYALGSMSENNSGFHSNYQGFSRGKSTRGGDFGSALGFDITVELRGKYLSSTIQYTFSQAKASSSYDEAAFGSVVVDAPLQEFLMPLRFVLQQILMQV